MIASTLNRDCPELPFIYDFFFFFQAEEGIRYHCVTGVQTCALPISADWRRLSRTVQVTAASGTAVSNPLSFTVTSSAPTLTAAPDLLQFAALENQTGISAQNITRSEERRVGKEGRSRWSPYH